jgi:hypothetical protein
MNNRNYIIYDIIKINIRNFISKSYYIIYIDNNKFINLI